MQRIYNLFLAVDATQVEINPFGLTPDGRGKMQGYIAIIHLTTWIHDWIQKLNRFMCIFPYDRMELCT
jgi:hypothetical protein